MQNLRATLGNIGEWAGRTRGGDTKDPLFVREVEQVLAFAYEIDNPVLERGLFALAESWLVLVGRIKRDDDDAPDKPNMLWADFLALVDVPDATEAELRDLKEQWELGIAPEEVSLPRRDAKKVTETPKEDDKNL